MDKTKLIIRGFIWKGDENFVYDFFGTRIEVTGDSYKISAQDASVQAEWEKTLNGMGFTKSNETIKFDYSKLLEDGFKVQKDFGYCKGFKTHIVCYNNGTVMFYFPNAFKEAELKDQKAREGRWKARFAKYGLPVIDFEILEA